MESNMPRPEDFRAGCAPHGGRGVRKGQRHVSPKPGQPQLAISQASGDGPHASTSEGSTPAENDVARTLLPLRHPCPSASVQGQERLDPQISIRQRVPKPGQPQLAISQASGDGPHASTSEGSTSAENDVERTLLPLHHPSASVQGQERLDPQISIRQRIPKPGQPQLAISQASGDGPHASTSEGSTPAENDVERMLLPLRHPCPSASVQGQERLDPRISIRQRILCEQLGILNQKFKSSWMQAYAQLKGEISDMHQDFVDNFSNLMKLATTEAEREDVRLKMATAREQVFSGMKTRIRASCVDFGDWRWHQLNNRLQTARKELFDDGNYDALVAVLENQVYRSNCNFQKRAFECAHAVWDEFVKDLGLEKEFLPV